MPINSLFQLAEGLVHRRPLIAPRTALHSRQSAWSAGPRGSNSIAASSMDVAVIGAGAAGLVAARELLREGHSVTVYEQGSDIGGVWRYSPETEDDPLGLNPNRRRVHSSMYRGLRTNLPREVMAFTDFPFLPITMQGRSLDSRQFPCHEEVYNYLKAFAVAFDLERHIQFNTRIERALPVAATLSPADAQSASTPAGSAAAVIADGRPGSAPNGSAFDLSEHRWQLTTSSSDSSGGNTSSSSSAEANGGTVRTFDALLVCNGHFSEPRLPDAAGSKLFPGRQMHSHNYREAGPFAGQRVVIVGAAASGEDIGREISETAAEVYISSRQWAGPTLSPEGPRRNIWRMPAFEGLTPEGAVLLAEDQVVGKVDTVVYSTGYVYDFPFLNEANVVTVEDNRVGPLYQHIWPPRFAPRLSFVGIPWKVLPFPQMELQSRWIARVLSGRVRLLSAAQMQEHVEAFYAALEKDGIAQRFTHRLDGEKQWRYNDMLIAACGADVPELPEWTPKLYEEAGNNRKERPGEYRDESLNDQFVQQAHHYATTVSQKVVFAT